MCGCVSVTVHALRLWRKEKGTDPSLWLTREAGAPVRATLL